MRTDVSHISATVVVLHLFPVSSVLLCAVGPSVGAMLQPILELKRASDQPTSRPSSRDLAFAFHIQRAFTVKFALLKLPLIMVSAGEGIYAAAMGLGIPPRAFILHIQSE